MSGDLLRFFVQAAIVVALVIGAIALGVKFFDTSTKESEEGHNWDS